MNESRERNRDALILHYQHYVKQVAGSLVTKMNLPHQMFDEYVSAGYLGLVEAAERYDSSHGKDFKSYAYLRIRGAIIDSIRRTADVPGYVYNRYVKALKAAHELREELYEQQSREKDKPVNDAMLSQVLEYLSLSALAFRISQHDVESELSSMEDSALNPGRLFEIKEDNEIIHSLIDSLPSKERYVVKSYYFEGKSLVSIAEEQGDVSRSWVSRLHARALKILKEKYSDAHAC